MKLLGGKHAGIWMMGKNRKHYLKETFPETLKE
jgi:hypothetical protein